MRHVFAAALSAETPAWIGEGPRQGAHTFPRSCLLPFLFCCFHSGHETRKCVCVCVCVCLSRWCFFFFLIYHMAVREIYNKNRKMATVTLWRVYAASLDNLHAKIAKNKEKKREGAENAAGKVGGQKAAACGERGLDGIREGAGGRVCFSRASQPGSPTPELPGLHSHFRLSWKAQLPRILALLPSSQAIVNIA
ncbi:uncharacterized protein LOC144327718 [Podarcis muralis]